MHKELVARLPGFSSDHTWWTIMTSFYSPSVSSQAPQSLWSSLNKLFSSPDNQRSVLSVWGGTWNMMNQCHSKVNCPNKITPNPYANNPLDIDESPQEWRARKLEQIKEIESIIKMKAAQSDIGPDYLLLQEADWELDPNLRKEYVKRLNALGWDIVASKPSRSQQHLVILYNTKTLQFTGKSRGVLEMNGKSRGFETEFTHIATKKPLVLTSLHLDYNADYVQAIDDLQKEKIRENKFMIMGGDTNHPLNRNMENLIGHWDYATNVHALPDGTLSIDENANQGQRNTKKHYDGFFVSPDSQTFAYITERLSKFFSLDRFCRVVQTNFIDMLTVKGHDHTSLVGRPWKRTVYTLRDFDASLQDASKTPQQRLEIYQDMKKMMIERLHCSEDPTDSNYYLSHPGITTLTYFNQMDVLYKFITELKLQSMPLVLHPGVLNQQQFGTYNFSFAKNKPNAMVAFKFPNQAAAEKFASAIESRIGKKKKLQGTNNNVVSFTHEDAKNLGISIEDMQRICGPFLPVPVAQISLAASSSSSVPAPRSTAAAAASAASSLPPAAAAASAASFLPVAPATSAAAASPAASSGVATLPSRDVFVAYNEQEEVLQRLCTVILNLDALPLVLHPSVIDRKFDPYNFNFDPQRPRAMVVFQFRDNETATDFANAVNKIKSSEKKKIVKGNQVNFTNVDALALGLTMDEMHKICRPIISTKDRVAMPSASVKGSASVAETVPLEPVSTRAKLRAGAYAQYDLDDDVQVGSTAFPGVKSPEPQSDEDVTGPAFDLQYIAPANVASTSSSSVPAALPEEKISEEDRLTQVQRLLAEKNKGYEELYANYTERFPATIYLSIEDKPLEEAAHAQLMAHRAEIIDLQNEEKRLLAQTSSKGNITAPWPQNVAPAQTQPVVQNPAVSSMQPVATNEDDKVFGEYAHWRKHDLQSVLPHLLSAISEFDTTNPSSRVTFAFDNEGVTLTAQNYNHYLRMSSYLKGLYVNKGGNLDSLRPQSVTSNVAATPVASVAGSLSLSQLPLSVAAASFSSTTVGTSPATIAPTAAINTQASVVASTAESSAASRKGPPPPLPPRQDPVSEYKAILAERESLFAETQKWEQERKTIETLQQKIEATRVRSQDAMLEELNAKQQPTQNYGLDALNKEKQLLASRYVEIGNALNSYRKAIAELDEKLRSLSSHVKETLASTVLATASSSSVVATTAQTVAPIAVHTSTVVPPTATLVGTVRQSVTSIARTSSAQQLDVATTVAKPVAPTAKQQPAAPFPKKPVPLAAGVAPTPPKPAASAFFAASKPATPATAPAPKSPPTPAVAKPPGV